MINAKLNHIAITISKEENLAFYKELGFKETLRNVREEKHDIIVFMEGCGTTIEVFIDPSHPLHQDKEPMGLRHIAFEVQDLLKTREQLANFNPTPINPKYNIFFVKDPDGQEIEFREHRV